MRRQEVKDDLELGKPRYVRLKNRSNLTAGQTEMPEAPKNANLETAEAYQMRLTLQDFYEQANPQARGYRKVRNRIAVASFIVGKLKFKGAELWPSQPKETPVVREPTLSAPAPSAVDPRAHRAWNPICQSPGPEVSLPAHREADEGSAGPASAPAVT